MKILARKLNEFTTEYLWENLKGNLTIVFDDGEVDTTAKMVIYSHYAWEYHRQYPKTPLMKSHFIQTVLNGSKLGARSHIQLLQNILWDTFDAYPESKSQAFVDELAKLAYFITNSYLYNDISYKAEAYVNSLDIVDFIEIIDNEKVKSVLQAAEPTQFGIESSYAAINYALKKDPSLENNPLSKGTRSKLVKEGQVLQCLGPRGKVTDIDSNYFDKPIMRGYVQGFRSLYDSMIESRSAAKALYFSKKELQDAEYFSRKLQLLCETVERLHYGDCGSTNYLTWHVKPKTVDSNGDVIYNGDLQFLVGKYYLDPETNTLKAITINDKHLEDKAIKIRSVVAGCNHPDPYGICSVCFGQMADVVPENTNIGQYTSTTLTQKSSQSILSTKHHDGSSTADSIHLTPEEKKYFKTATDGVSYILSDQLKSKNVRVIISSQEAQGMTDITFVNDVHKLAMTRISEISDIGFITEHRDIEKTDYFTVSRGKRFASLTYAALEYIRNHGWSVDDKRNFIIDLSDWNFQEKFLSLPARHFNMSDVTQSIAQMLESNMREIKNSDEMKDPEAILTELFDLVTKHLDINIAVLEVTLLGAMVVSNQNRDFRIPKAYTTREMGASKQTIPNRSMGAAMAYEYHVDTIFDPASFFKENRPDHQFDVMLCPNEVLANH